MAKKQRNILDFCNSSQRLFIATWVLALFVIIIILLSNQSSQSASEAIPLLFISSLVFGLISIIGSLACKKMLNVLADKKKALKKSNRVHRCQLYIVILLFLFLIGVE